MKSIIAEFEIVTPMFMAGAEQGKAELRVSAIKAELVFWWRALNYSRYCQEEGRDHCGALAKMHKDEAKIFGGAAGANFKGQGAFFIKIAHKSLGKKENYGQLANKLGAGGQYLGYGLKEDQNNSKPHRGYIDGGMVAIDMVFRKGFSTDIQAQVLNALKIMGLLGGLGSRKRRGWGCVSLLSLQTTEHDFKNKSCNEVGSDYRAPATEKAYQDEIGRLIGDRQISGIEFPLSAFAAETDIRLWQNANFSNAIDAINGLGAEFMNYRSWGRGGGASRKNFEADHDWFKSAFSGDVNKKHEFNAWKSRSCTIPERANFGLPHNYFKANGNKPLKLEVSPQDRDRRASPLFFHIAKIGTRYFPVAIHFNNLFLPGGAKLKGNSGKLNFEFTPNAQVITDFLNGAKRNAVPGNTNSEGSAGKPFTRRIWP